MADRSIHEPMDGMTHEELTRLKTVAHKKGWDLWVEPCGECCTEPVARVTAIGSFGTAEAETFVDVAPDLFTMVDDANRP